MKLQPEHFDFMKMGKKTIELRLHDEKRKTIQLGDTIEFMSQSESLETLTVTVCGLLVYPTFFDLFKDFGADYFGMSTEELLEVLEKYYSLDEQKKHAVLGIKFVLNG